MVLIAEDIPYNQEVNRRLLGKCNVDKISIANNGQEAVKLFEEMGPNYFDLILMDIDMPVMDGKLATKKIRKIEEEQGWPPTYITFLTAYSESKTQKELLDPKGGYRANQFLSKPASLEMIQNVLKECANKPKGALRLRSISKVDPERLAQNFQGINSSMERRLGLVVEDDAYSASMMRRMLERHGFEVLQASNSQIALELYNENWRSILCVLMNCELPVMDGLQVTQKILAKYSKIAAFCGKEITVYGVTGHIGEEYKQKCLNAGMKNILIKPVTIENLQTLIAKFINPTE